MQKGMAEVPLVYPCQESEGRRFVVNDVDGTIVEDTENNGRSPAAASAGPFNAATELERLRGCASVSALRLGMEEAVVTSSAIPDEPGILSLTMSRNRTSAEPSVSVELDIGREMTKFSHPVEIQCFALSSEGDDSIIVMLMVDVKGTILSLGMDAESLEPLSSTLKLRSVRELLENRAEDGEAIVTDTEIHSTMIAFVSPTVALVAISPLLLTVDVELGQIALWSEIQCLEEMHNRRYMFGNILSAAGNMLLGNGEENFIDIPPTAALCAVSTDSTECDVFTLHSDASLRRWRINPSASLQPYEVHRLHVPHQDNASNEPEIPAPSLWSHSFNAVSLCARLYESIFDLAVYVHTTYSSIPSDKRGGCLMVFRGSQEGGEAIESSLNLSVPDSASALVGMDFVQNMKPCSLRAVFRIAPQMREHFGGSVIATYPPNSTSIVTTQPILMSPDHTLDGVARDERDRISSLSFKIQNNTATIDEDLHELDSKYMKYLFHPYYPRGSGTVVAPTVASIRKAIAKLVPGFSKVADPSMSIQVETLNAVHTWRKLDSTDRTLGTPPSPSVEQGVPGSTSKSSSVYHSFVPAGKEMSTMQDSSNDMHSVDDFETEKEDYSRSIQTTAHQKRWKRLLLAVWEEERLMRSPLCLANIPFSSGPETYLVRVGVTSALSEKSQDIELLEVPQDDRWDMLDQRAVLLLTRIQRKQDMCDRLSSVETDVWDIVSRAQLLLPSASGAVSMQNAALELLRLGKWAIDDECHAPNTTSPDVSGEALKQVIDSMQDDNLIAWLAQLPKVLGSFPLLSFISGEPEVGESQSTTRANGIPGTNTRHAASSLAIRCVDSARRLYLARCLLLFGVRQHHGSAGSPLQELVQQRVFTWYVHAMSVVWTCSQLVPTPSAMLQPRVVSRQRREDILHMPAEGSALSSSPRPTTEPATSGTVASSGLVGKQSNIGVASMTTALDVRIIHLSQLMDAMNSPVDVVTRLARMFLDASFGFDMSSLEAGDPAKVASTFPELGALPPPTSDGVASDYPRLALRLLAPFVSLAPAGDSAQVVRARREAAAECLLIESNALSRTGTISESRKREVMRQACRLLVPSSATGGVDNAADLDKIETAYEFLTSTAKEPSYMARSGAQVDNLLENRLLEIVCENGVFPDTVTSFDIHRLCQNPGAKTMLSPLVSHVATNLDQVTNAGIKLLVLALVRVSSLIHRLTVLERHMSSVGRNRSSISSSSSELIEYIESAITEVSDLLPQSVYRSLPEYATLWSMLFRHSVAGQRWRNAYNACVDNPVLERKVNNFRILVAVMADSGSLGELLGLCSVVTGKVSFESQLGGIGECVELYELAAETLADAAVRTAKTHPYGPKDYSGCLYSLHAHLGHWRRAAQAMNLRHHLATTVVATAENTKVKTVLEHLSLASLGALHALIMIKDPTRRFLLDEGNGPYPIIAAITIQEFKDGQEENQGLTDRLAQPQTAISLTRQFARATVLRTILLDGFLPYGKSESMDDNFTEFRRVIILDRANSADTDRDVIDTLSSCGYYQKALLLAETMRNTYQELSGGQPNGRDQVHDSICYIVKSYLVPTAMRSSKPFSDAAGGIDVEFHRRPTCTQLCRAFNEISVDKCSSQLPPHVIGEKWRKMQRPMDSRKGSVAMALTRELVIKHTTLANPLALEVAADILDSGMGEAQLPNWLEQFLIGSRDGRTGGLFARRSIPGESTYFGDPAGLLRMYVKREMYVEACNLVCEVLTGSTKEGGIEITRASRASSRLPEKGDIDFVPICIIDLLWDGLVTVMRSPSIGASEKMKLTEAQLDLEQVLRKHLDLGEISDMGMHSVRVLNQ